MSARRMLAAALAVVAVGTLALPETAHACAMCFSGPAETRRAFFVTAAFLTLLPLGMVAGAGAWLRSKVRAAESEETDAGSSETSTQ